MLAAITGATGLIGQALEKRLTEKGHQVLCLVRKPARPNEIQWDTAQELAQPERLENCQAVVHLAGENIADGRWTDEKKKRIRDTRLQGTEHLCRALAQLKTPPPFLLSGSATGIYGNRGEEVLTEDSPAGTGFLAELCQEWEAATRSAEERGIRLVHLRTGIVLSENGGALGKMLMPFKFGLGGKIGSGEQYMSWIVLEDLIAAIEHLIAHTEINGPVNGTAPNPATNAEFTERLGQALQRPTIFSVPAFAARFAFGELADEALLAGARVMPTRLLGSGFQFKYPELAPALKKLVG